MINDLKCLVSTLAREDSFSKFSMGGGPEHNMNLVPFFIHGSFMVWLEDPEYQHFRPVKAMERYFEDFIKDQPISESQEEEMKIDELSDEEEKMSENSSESEQKEIQNIH